MKIGYMKKFLIILSLLLGSLLSFAENRAQQAEQLYAEGKYVEAVNVYDTILSGGMESAALYYNLGNCYYKLGENTQAIINYERSLLLNPRDVMTRYNLKMAQQTIVDKIEVLPELFLVRWYKGIETYFSADQWGYLSVILFVVFLIMAVLFFYSRSIGIKKTGFVIGVFVFFLTMGTVFFAVQQNSRILERNYAIITTPSVTVKGAPDNSGTSLFLVHEGLKVKVIGELGAWYNIRLADGNEGWLSKLDIEKI